MAPLRIFIDRVVDQQKQEHAVPRDIPNPMHQGDTVEYLSGRVGDLVTIVFDQPDMADPPSLFQSPFLDSNGHEKRVVKSTDGAIPVSNRGRFFCKCFLTSSEKTHPDIGWAPNSPQSGGNHEVK
jgi:hypothetical protein